MYSQVGTLVSMLHINAFLLIFYNDAGIKLGNTKHGSNVFGKLIMRINYGINNSAASIMVAASD